MDWLKELFIDEAKPAMARWSGAGGRTDNEEWIGDGNTHIWVTLPEGGLSPMMGVCPNGMVSVDWGDGTEPDVLTGSSASNMMWTENHQYAKPGDYVITITVISGTLNFMGSGASSANNSTRLLRYSQDSELRNAAYAACIKKIEFGTDVRVIGNYSFAICRSLSAVFIPQGVTSIGSGAFNSCSSLSKVFIPDSVTSVNTDMFRYCYSLSSVRLPSSVTSVPGNSFSDCYSLSSVELVNGMSTIWTYSFSSCYSLSYVAIPESVTTIGAGAFYNCCFLARVDFSKHKSVPSLGDVNVFNVAVADFKILVPAALYDEWIAANNWSTYAANIVAV